MQNSARPPLDPPVKQSFRLSASELIARGLLRIGDGYRAKNSEFGPSGLPFVRVNNIVDGFDFRDVDYYPVSDLHRVGEKISQAGDVVLTSKGTVGRVAFVEPDIPQFVYSPQLCFWRSLDHCQVLPRFLFYWMQGREFSEQAEGLKSQTDMADYISLSDQRRMTITLPPIQQQCAATRILEFLDAKIAVNRRMNHTLEQIARAIFKSWFVDFDPVVAKSEDRKPVGLTADIATRFTSEFRDTELGALPKGWRTGQLTDLAHINASSRTRDFPYPVIQYVDISSVSCGRLEGTIPHETFRAPSRAQRIVSHGDTIWSCVRPNRKSFLFIAHPPANMVVSTGFVVLTPKDPAMIAYLYQYVTTDDFVEYLTARAEGSAYPAVRSDDFAVAPILIPPPEVLERFEAIVRPTMELRAQNEREAHTLASLRDTLLPKLLSGKIRVQEGDEAVEAA